MQSYSTRQWRNPASGLGSADSVIEPGNGIGRDAFGFWTNTAQNPPLDASPSKIEPRPSSALGQGIGGAEIADIAYFDFGPITGLPSAEPAPEQLCALPTSIQQSKRSQYDHTRSNSMPVFQLFDERFPTYEPLVHGISPQIVNAMPVLPHIAPVEQLASLPIEQPSTPPSVRTHIKTPRKILNSSPVLLGRRSTRDRDEDRDFVPSPSTKMSKAQSLSRSSLFDRTVDKLSMSMSNKALLSPRAGQRIGAYVARPPPNVRQFQCDECVQSFNRNHDLKRHKRIHLIVKPFPCGWCEKSFSRKDALKRHLLVKTCGRGLGQTQESSEAGISCSPVAIAFHQEAAKQGTLVDTAEDAQEDPPSPESAAPDSPLIDRTTTCSPAMARLSTMPTLSQPDSLSPDPPFLESPSHSSSSTSTVSSSQSDASTRSSVSTSSLLPTGSVASASTASSFDNRTASSLVRSPRLFASPLVSSSTNALSSKSTSPAQSIFDFQPPSHSNHGSPQPSKMHYLPSTADVQAGMLAFAEMQVSRSQGRPGPACAPDVQPSHSYQPGYWPGPEWHDPTTGPDPFLMHRASNESMEDRWPPKVPQGPRHNMGQAHTLPYFGLQDVLGLSGVSHQQATPMQWSSPSKNGLSWSQSSATPPSRTAAAQQTLRHSMAMPVESTFSFEAMDGCTY